MAHLQMVYLLKMVIFYSYVKLPEGMPFLPISIYQETGWFEYVWIAARKMVSHWR